jgi:hypothetical protein
MGLVNTNLSDMLAPIFDRRSHMSITSEEEWAERAAAFLKHKLKEAEVTYVELAKRLKKHGFKEETEASITMRLKRGSFPATWFLAVLAALELDGVALEEI